MSDTKLKPCPFCGGEAVVIGVSTIWCENEDCGCEFTNINKEKLIKGWNTRKPVDAMVERLNNKLKQKNKLFLLEDRDAMKYFYEMNLLKEIIKMFKKAGGIDG